MTLPHDFLAQPPAVALELLRRRIIENEAKLPTKQRDDDNWYLRWWSADALVLLGDYSQAIAVHPPASSMRATMQMERLLSLKLAADVAFVADDIMALLGPKVTAFGRKNIVLVTEAAQALMGETTAEAHVSQLRQWSESTEPRQYQVYIGSPYGYEASKHTKLAAYAFSTVPNCVEYCCGIARKAENMVREEAGIPRVGEGWISETILFRQVRDAFPGETVMQHASPSWLGRQHFDVYLPGRKVALEYQGLQHDQPVSYFGGEQAYRATLKRDARKRTLAQKNGVVLLYVRPGYSLENILGLIVNRGI